MKFTSVLFSAVLALFSVTAQAADPQPGVDYTVYSPPQPVDAAPGKIEVSEFFFYTCPHCADMEPLITNWLKTAPKDVSFRRVPVLFRPNFVPLAKIYYTLEVMNLVEKLNGQVFDAIHKQRLDLADEKVLLEWVASKGVDANEFGSVYRSFAIQSKVQRADQITKGHGIPGTPALVVNGKYLVSSGDHEKQLKTVDYLIAKERAAAKKK